MMADGLLLGSVVAWSMGAWSGEHGSMERGAGRGRGGV